jgi:hypothetical protein
MNMTSFAAKRSYSAEHLLLLQAYRFKNGTKTPNKAARQIIAIELILQ